MLDRPKLLHNILNELLEPRCAISGRDVQVLFVGRDLYTHNTKKGWSVFIPFSQHEQKSPPTFSICKKNNLF